MTTTTKPTLPAQQTSSPSQSPHPTLALAADPSKALRLAPTFQPDVDLLTSEGVIVFGVKGSGKSNLLALLVEQLGRFLLPQIILDTEREYQSLASLLPHGVLATATRCPSGADILHKGLQVIVDLHSWETDEAAALALCHLIQELFTTTNAIAPQDRVPCVIHLDEAGYWLPQDAVTYLSKETRKALADAFHKVATRGRKQGLTPFLYTQSISEVAKSVIRQAGVKVLMRQTLDVDLTRYCQYIQGATPRTKRAIAAFPSGKALVLLPDGSQHRVQFHERQSAHVSHTPQAHTALVTFAAMQIDVTSLPMRDLTASSAPTNHQARVLAGTRTQPGAPPQQGPTPQPVTERVYALLARDPALRPVDLMKLAGCSHTTASQARITYFEQHPDLAALAAPAKGRGPHPVTERVAALLSLNPALKPIELMKLAGCSQSAASQARTAYVKQHPEHAPPRPPTATARISALLAEIPTLRVVDLMTLVGCNQALASRARIAYFERHPEQEVDVERGKRPEPVTERVYDLLAETPTLRVVDLMTLTPCSKATASRARATYFERHPEQQGRHEQG